MALSQKHRFAKETVRLADLAKALSHPARIQILQILAARTRCLCGELVADLPLSQSTVSQHLRQLKEVGLIVGEIEGPRSCYCLDRRELQTAAAAFSALLDEIVVRGSARTTSRRRSAQPRPRGARRGPARE